MYRLIVLLCFTLISHTIHAQDDSKKEALKLIEVSGAKVQMQMVKNQLLKYVPKVKQAAFLSDYEASLPQLYDSYADVYLKLYTPDEIKTMIAFYESPVGKKMYANASEMSQRSQALQEVWIVKLQGLVQKYQSGTD
ncbi:DUF2059 domain-containing protein [Flavobacterium pallidum]|uniref:DUF2059 domain-containing protein n=1 Tax=Flavobacterium pallidum TaxID=2172098 RepID=A0A2S1SFU5_9FLAO|nr:DUF2059 domain-containing protein [Flavobacterium pallidum]AWI25283.1 hypothetical protein HYN49_04875 [Flavobacterium pallidum]